MPNYDDHSKILTELERDQEAERERRETAREVHCFLDDDDGQWESRVKDVMSTQQRPRYTFDKCNDIVDDIAGEMEQADFDIKVKPAGGDASKDIAQTYDGLIRNIENLSGAKDVFNDSGRSMIRAGIDGWRVVQRYGDNDSFDQDLFIDPVADFLERVWFDRNSVRQTREDAKHCWVLEDFDRDAYKARWPKGSEQSVNVDSDYFDAADNIVVGEILYKIRRKTRIVEMSNGAIYRDDEKYQAIKDELALRGILEVRDRNRTMDVVMSRLFDGGGWLTEARETVFDYLPIIPTYGNFSVTKKKVVYWGIITKKLDAQRVYNYAESRKVEEGALAPLEKLIATDEQVEGHEDEWAHLNTSADPALFYTHVDGPPPPYKLGGAQINPGLETVSQSALLNLQSSSQLERLPGQPVGLRSGVAVELEQNKGDTRNYKYTVSQEKAICHTAKILVRAIPKVYDSKRQVRILNEDGSYDMVVLNEPIYDDESRQMVTVNDLSQGIYDVTCDVGPAFKNRQSETVSAFNELATIYPDILQEGADVYMQNVSSPGADVVAERIRRRMLLSGSIPEEQMTDEEKELVQSIEPEPDPVAEALQREADNADDKVELEGAKLVLEEQKFAAKQQQDSMTEAFDTMKTAAEELKAQADTMKILVEALGLDNPLVRKQAAVIADSQAEQP